MGDRLILRHVDIVNGILGLIPSPAIVPSIIFLRAKPAWPARCRSLALFSVIKSDGLRSARAGASPAFVRSRIAHADASDIRGGFFVHFLGRALIALKAGGAGLVEMSGQFGDGLGFLGGATGGDEVFLDVGDNLRADGTTGEVCGRC